MGCAAPCPIHRLNQHPPQFRTFHRSLSRHAQVRLLCLPPCSFAQGLDTTYTLCTSTCTTWLPLRGDAIRLIQARSRSIGIHHRCLRLSCERTRSSLDTPNAAISRKLAMRVRCIICNANRWVGRPCNHRKGTQADQCAAETRAGSDNNPCMHVLAYERQTWPIAISVCGQTFAKLLEIRVSHIPFESAVAPA